MKTLLIVRHAKSSWSEIGVSDFDRPLNERGLTDAPVMAQKMLQEKQQLEAIYSSSAKRAMQTAKFFQKLHGVESQNFTEFLSLYHASETEILQQVKKIDPMYSCVALFGHNPGLSYFVGQICQIAFLDIPTCGVVKMDFNSDWSNCSAETLVEYKMYFPKLL